MTPGAGTRFYDGMMGVRPFAQAANPISRRASDGRVYSEVNAALSGDTGTAERVDEQNKLVLSVAAPIQRFKAIYGVLMVSTESGDIDDILREERADADGSVSGRPDRDDPVIALSVAASSRGRCAGWRRRPTACAAGARAAKPFRDAETRRRDRRSGRKPLRHDARALRPHRRHRKLRRRCGA